MDKLNSILLRRYKKVLIPATISEPIPQEYITALMANIADLGFTLSKEVIDALNDSEIETVVDTYRMLESELQIMVGNNVKHIPLFRDFPKNVPNDTDYLFKRIIGYVENCFGFAEGANYKMLSCGHAVNTTVFDLSNFGACPICQMRVDMKDLGEEKDRPKMSEITKFKILNLGTKEELYKIFTNLVGANTSISETDKADVEIFFDLLKEEVVQYLPAQIPLKENIALVAKLSIKYLNDLSAVARYTKTATDLLRILTALSDGDVSLKTNVKFKNFSRIERKLFLSILDSLPNDITADMLKYKNRWIRVGERLHPGEFKTKYPVAFDAFQILRENIKYETYMSKVDKAIRDSDWVTANGLLKQRPGEFIRKLDLLLQISNENAEVIGTFKEIISGIPTRILVQVQEFFKHRSEKFVNRSFFPKGNVAKVKTIDDLRKSLTKETCTVLVDIIVTELSTRFGKMEAFGKVYIDPKLSDYLVPFSQRSASKALETITRGSKIDIPSEKYVRMFLHWMERDGERNDIDLSAILFDTNWEYKDHVSFTNLSGHCCKHSGDIQSAPAPNGASEFIDINIAKALEKNIRYVVMNIYDFTGEGFINLPICFAGIMGREDNHKGKIFEPKTVQQKFDVTSDTPVCIPLILDLQEMKMIWTDISLTQRGRYNTTESNEENIALMGKALVNLVKPDLYTLFKIHAEARGTLVKTRDEADVIFGIEDGNYTPSKIDQIMADFLS